MDELLDKNNNKRKDQVPNIQQEALGQVENYQQSNDQYNQQGIQIQNGLNPQQAAIQQEQNESDTQTQETPETQQQNEKRKRITINPITRLEGHAKIEIFLDESGNVKNSYFQVVELRGFERFCVGRPAEEMARITPRICGVCPSAHHIASTKALDNVFHVEVPEPAKKLRELFYNAHILHSHIAHFYALAAPDFVLGPSAPPEKRNILGVIDAVGIDIGKEVLKHRAYAQRIQEIIGGKATHPVCGLPGGMARPITEDERKKMEEMVQSCLKFSEFSIKNIFADVILKNEQYMDFITSKDKYYHETYYMGMVDKNNHVNFYDGDLKVIDPNGNEYARFQPNDYLDHVSEHVEEWSYLKFPYLKKKGWQGLRDGVESGLYRVNSLARLNVADGMATPLAQEVYKDFYSVFNTKPVHNTLAFHWARLVEMVYNSERMLELVQNPEITSKDIRTIPTDTPDEGVGCIEAPRGTLFHHYCTDEKGMITKVNLIVATAQNNGPICMSINKAASSFIQNWEVNEGLLNQVEMAFRAYDPCIACATHTLVDNVPIIVNIYQPDGKIFRKLPE